MIHDDLVFQILLWLPIAPLLRCKLVCKTWLNIIQTPQFIDQHHLHIHINSPKSQDDDALLIKRHLPPSTVFTILSGETYQVSHNISNSLYQNSVVRDSFVYKIVASCNGIICLADTIQISETNPDKNVILWNPATQQTRFLPKSNDLPDYMIENYGKDITFVYDVKTDDYKVLKFFFGWEYNWVELYNKSTNSWRDLANRLPITSIESDPRMPYRNGTYCWLVEHDSKEYTCTFKTYVILTFDIKKEMFGTMLLPDEFSYKKHTRVLGSRPLLDEVNYNISHIAGTPKLELNHHLSKITGTPRLAIVRDEILFIIIPEFSSSETDIGTNIWVLNDYGVERFWTKLHTLQLGRSIPSKFRWIGTSITGIIFVLHDEKCTNSYHLECCRKEDRKVCVYDTVTHETIILPILEPDERFLEIVQYKRSLVSIECINGESSKVPSIIHNPWRARGDF